MPYKNPEDKKRWIQANQDKNREANKKWRESHPQENRQRLSVWKSTNAQKVIVSVARRRALKLNCEAPLTNDEWAQILKDFSGLCFWCGDIATEQEHLIPLSKGGAHSSGNVVPSCGPCNRKKGTKDPLVFLYEIS